MFWMHMEVTRSVKLSWLFFASDTVPCGAPFAALSLMSLHPIVDILLISNVICRSVALV
jgi:hypothetical protein